MYITLETKEVKLLLLQRGATIYQLHTKNMEGQFKNIILTHESINQYDIENQGYFGATCGRIAGRISQGKFTIDGKNYELTKNDNGINTLHGGEKNLSKVIWDYEVLKDENQETCIFTYKSKDGEEGFPAEVDLKVEYILYGNKLDIKYYGKSDRKTYLNLTNHSYFNLSDSENHIYNHSLQILSDKFLEISKMNIPKQISYVENSPFDFRILRKIGNISLERDENILGSKGYNHPFELSKEGKYDLYLKDDTSGRSVKIETSYPYIVMYTYNETTNTKLLDRKNIIHSGVAFEPQYAPNAVNDDRFFIDYLDVDKPYFNYIKYEFN